MKEAFKKIFKDNIILWGFLTSLVLLVGVTLYIVLLYPQLPPALLVYNRLSWGYSRLGGILELCIPLGITIAFCVINVFVAATVYNKVVLLSRMVSAISFVIALCTSIYIVNIMHIIL